VKRNVTAPTKSTAEFNSETPNERRDPPLHSPTVLWHHDFYFGWAYQEQVVSHGQHTNLMVLLHITKQHRGVMIFMLPNDTGDLPLHYIANSVMVA
jgi:hypothetical protein